MENVIYKAPKAELTDGKVDDNHEFYVVSTTKFTILFLATFGLYSLYWFYRNWKMYKDHHEEDIWPVARCIFAIFFAHSLFGYVNRAIENKGLNYNWSPSLLATLYVLFAIAGRITDRLSEKSIGSPFTDITSIVLVFATLFVLLKVQTAINLSQEDQWGETNSKLTLANYLWCFLGLAIWGIILISLAVVFGLVNV